MIVNIIRRRDFYLIPNILTLSRVAAIPLVGTFAYLQWNMLASALFALAGLSDYVDGWIARKYRYESKLGMLLDPLCDKLIIVATIIVLFWLGRLNFHIEGWLTDFIPLVLVIVTVSREIAITGLRSIASTVGLVMPAERGGKIKTWIQFFAVIFLLWANEPFLTWGQILLALSVVAALWSGVTYTIKFVRQLPS